ncbi:antitoxin component YwqK of YwqJK toxin-antitoxin module [Oceanihabitans sediminis]|uniref:Toxin-antitoxin system YwqK family antitoxin n=1 Tax=Oceanihabitans sediminis TaxID=1812012 RepID=A0A368P5S0_9FLAO|nr:preprotein translocase YidC [Oceanihabitans sediminis]MDX1774399.1 toxin-antitoxin system YwqK family antitoxin [Oceanihabitans sediminis]RBP29798.1 antitoxin component YwqK of YwqJK toxin-antitoxin module [Oceanihabitans sediminis]RCU57139.1 toxin-antitoxin system YwqK family antitoxin [Oceanihabitans sediminis]
MKNLLFFCVFILSIFASAQDINQLDAKGKRHGIWKKNFENTNVLRYEGEFLHGKEIGVFKYYKNVNGKPVIAATKEFNKDNNLAKVSFFASTGKLISEGQMDGKLFVGAWTYYQNRSKNILSIDNYNDKGELDGERLVYYDNGALAQKEIYVNGKLHGPSIWYSETGVVIKEYAYDAGELHGPAKYYTKNGVMVLEGQYKRDRKDGVWKYYENGKLVKEKDFTRKSKNPYKK